jgi:hypothetical protein
MSLDNNYPSSNLSPDPTTSARVDHRDTQLDQGSNLSPGPGFCPLGQATSFKRQAPSNKRLTRYPIYCRIKTERKHMSTQKQYNGLLELDEKLNKVEIEINETKHNLSSLEDRKKILLEIINRMDSETN